MSKVLVGVHVRMPVMTWVELVETQLEYRQPYFLMFSLT